MLFCRVYALDANSVRCSVSAASHGYAVFVCLLFDSNEKQRIHEVEPLLGLDSVNSLAVNGTVTSIHQKYLKLFSKDEQSFYGF